MLNLFKSASLICTRTYKNFGHKREPIPLFTTLWHGFLTFTFIGLILDWERIARMLFGKDHGVEIPPWHSEARSHIPNEADKRFDQS